MDSPDDSAVAVAMGFASFGSQNPQKKRKYNHRADAVSDRPPRPSGTGSNMTPLGNPKPSGSANVEEIDLDDDDTAGDAEPVEGEATSKPEGLLHHASLPSRPPLVDPQPRTSNAAGERRQHESRNNGNPWYEGYYDPTSNQNPWERLEKKMGIDAKGPWLSKAAWNGSAPAG